MPEQLKLAPFRSFADLSFFTRLSEKKLNELKLSEHNLPLCASYGVPISDNKSPTLHVSGNSIDNDEGDYDSIPISYIAPGYVKNVNTIESFKALNKSQLMNDEGAKLIRSIKDKSILEDPSRLVSFHVITFSDLKKYKFFYWFGFPSITTEWTTDAVTANTDLNVTKAIDSWKSTVPQKEWGFYLLKKSDEGWVVGKLSEYATFFGDAPVIVGYQESSTLENVLGWQARNFFALLGTLGFNRVTVLSHRDHAHLDNSESKSLWVDVSIRTDLNQNEEVKVTGWERNKDDKLAPKLSDLNALMNPTQRADQSVDLNLKLMKWRIAPKLDLDTIQHTSCLLLGAGTLGSYIARGLLGWGVRKITLVDNGKVSFSNPVRQPLYRFEDCLNGGAPKAQRAAEALKEIYPSVVSEGYELEIPMAGHPLTNEDKQMAEYSKLVELIEAHDAIFLLMDSRESRWLPSVICSATNKLVFNVALGFDTSLVMRHGIAPIPGGNPHLGCYFCNDVVAPIDSVSNQTLDQMCTVTRPGIAMSASSSAIELFASVLQHPEKGKAPASEQQKPGEETEEESNNPLSVLPHQLRTYLHNFSVMKIWGPSYPHCSACSPPVTQQWLERGWDFVKEALNNPGYVEEVSGLKQVQEEAERLESLALNGSDDDF